MIEGCGTTNSTDTENSVIVPGGCEIPEMPIPLRWRHGKDIGSICWVRKTPVAIFLRASIFENETFIWRAFDDGEMFRMSIGFEKITEPRLANGVLVYDRWRLDEVSVCQDGAINRDAHCLKWVAPQFQPVPLLQGLPQGMRL